MLLVTAEYSEIADKVNLSTFTTFNVIAQWRKYGHVYDLPNSADRLPLMLGVNSDS